MYRLGTVIICKIREKNADIFSEFAFIEEIINKNCCPFLWIFLLLCFRIVCSRDFLFKEGLEYDFESDFTEHN